MRFLLIGVLIEAATVQAQAPASEPVLVTSGAFFALSVPDLAASRAWYEEKLGLKVTLTPPPYQGVEAVILEGGGLIVELIHNPAAKRSEQDPVLTHGFFKAGVIIEDYEGTLNRLRQRGVTIALGPFPAGNGQRANFIIRDNAGNLIQFFRH